MAHCMEACPRRTGTTGHSRTLHSAGNSRESSRDRRMRKGSSRHCVLKAATLSVHSNVAGNAGLRSLPQYAAVLAWRPVVLFSSMVHPIVQHWQVTAADAKREACANRNNGQLSREPSRCRNAKRFNPETFSSQRRCPPKAWQRNTARVEWSCLHHIMTTLRRAQRANVRETAKREGNGCRRPPAPRTVTCVAAICSARRNAWYRRRREWNVPSGRVARRRSGAEYAIAHTHANQARCSTTYHKYLAKKHANSNLSGAAAPSTSEPEIAHDGKTATNRCW